jgi:NADPH2:quinone reductase
MKAYRTQRLQGPQSLALEEVADPAPGPGEVVIAVEAAGVGIADIAALLGQRQPRPSLPFTPGLEVAGRVDAAGAGVEDVAPGTRVVAFMPWGGLVERAVAKRETLVVLPDGIPAPTAAALPLAHAGGLLALEARAGLQEGQRILVLGAGGHSGLAAVALAKRLGATVIAAANGADRLELARAQGADHVVDAGTVVVGTAATELTGGAGVDVIFDAVGGKATAAALPALARGGKIVAAGFASGQAPTLDLIQLFSRGGKFITANTVLEAERDPAEMREALARVVKWTEHGKLTPRVSAEFPFADIQDAFKYLAERRATGAVVLKTG